MLSVDTESDPDTGTLLGISCSYISSIGMYFPINHLEEDANIPDSMLQELFNLLDWVPLRVFHNAAHDLEVLRKVNCKVDHLPFADTMIMAHMVDENVVSKSLDYLHKHYTGKEGKNRSELMQGMINTMGWRFVPVVLMDEYAANDAAITLELFERLLPLYEEQYGQLYRPYPTD